MKSLKNELSKHLDREFDVEKELPFIGADDVAVLDVLAPCDGVTLWLCEDCCGNRSIVRDDISGVSVVGLSSSREDQLTIAAWNVDFDIRKLAKWISDEDLIIAQGDADDNAWTFGE